MDKTWIILIIFGIAVTGFRLFRANKQSKEQGEIKEAQKQENTSRLEQLVQSEGCHADCTINTSCTSLALDRTAGKLLGTSTAVSGGKVMLTLDELESARLLDRSEEYRHCQEMETYYTGVHRTSMYRPYGGHSNKEVKQGHADFQTFTGEMVFGLELLKKSGQKLKLPFYQGDGTMFWTEEDNLVQAKRFAGELNSAISQRS